MTSNADDATALSAPLPRNSSDLSKLSHTRHSPKSLSSKVSTPTAVSKLSAVKKEDQSSATAAAVEDAAQNESEAETDILSDAAPEETIKAKRTVKREEAEGDDHERNRRKDKHQHSYSLDTVARKRHRDDSVDEMDHDDPTRRNGTSGGRSTVSVGSKTDRHRRKSNSTALSGSPHSSAPSSRQEAARSPSETNGSPPAPSIKSPSHKRGRSMSIAESRKRKAGDEAFLKTSEPPKQRQKMDGPPSARESPSLRNNQQPNSPVSSGVHGKPHRRSASTQSALQTTQPRRRRDVTNLILQSQKRDSWGSPSSSDGDWSRQPTPPAIQSHNHVKRASHRSLTSPARTMVNDKKKTDKFGATKLAREAEKGDLHAVKSAYLECPDDLDQSDFAGITPLQKASLNGHVDIVEFLINKGCKTDCQSDNRDTPLIDAAENGHLDVIRVLLRKGKVNPHHQNKKGERAIDLIQSDDEDFEEMSKELKEAMLKETDASHNDGPPTSAKAEPSALLYNEYNTETLKAKAAEGNIQLVGELLASNVKPNIQCGVAAARAGHDEILSLFLAEGLKPDPDPVKHPDTPMTVAIGRGHLRVIELLLSFETFDPTRTTKDGKAYYELAEERRGPKWEQERDLLKTAYLERTASRHKGSPRRERKQATAGSLGQAKQRLSRKLSPRPSERSSSPSRADGKRQLSRKSAVSEADHPKGRRLLSGKEMSSQREAAAKRQRRVVDDHDSSSGSDVPTRRPTKKLASEKHRAASEDGETKPIKKKSIKPRSEDHTKVPKVRPSSPAVRSDGSGDERARKRQKKISTKPHSVEPSKSRAAVQPTPETSSDADTNRAALKKSSKSVSASKVKIEPGSVSSSAATKSTVQPSSPTDTSKSANHPSPRAPSEHSVPSPAAPPEPKVPSRTPTPVREERLAEAKRKEEERIAAEKAIEEARLAEERARWEAEKARLKAEREERLSKLPAALRGACEDGFNRPLVFDDHHMGPCYSFYPIDLFDFSSIDPASCADLSAEDPARTKKYMLSFAAVGILGCPELDIALAYPDWERRPVTAEQWQLFNDQYCIDRMVQYKRLPNTASPDWDEADVNHQRTIAKEQMRALAPIYWIPFEAFEKEIKEGPALNYEPTHEGLDQGGKDQNGVNGTGPEGHHQEAACAEERIAKEKFEFMSKNREMLRKRDIKTREFIKIRRQEPSVINGNEVLLKKSFKDLVEKGKTSIP